ncbi:reverse transcriptase domain-containing protein [Patescibacteria group bacterium]
MRRIFSHSYDDIIGLENFLLAWEEFLVGKKSKPDVQRFGRRLFDNILALHDSLSNTTYCHGGYTDFYITDPKRRHIHKASVRDRLVHHAVYRQLYPFFDQTFVADSYSCRLGKGTHKALDRFRDFAYRVSHNNTRSCWVLKCDIRKFFDSIDHELLCEILNSYIPNEDIRRLLENIIASYRNNDLASKGLPLGNLTSQLFANIYMNEFDQWIKHKLKTKYYVRYADDFVILGDNEPELKRLVFPIYLFLKERLRLDLHPKKVFIRTLASGVDFLGWVHFPDHRVLRQTTKRRALAKIKSNPVNEALQSYLGLAKHGNAKKFSEQIRNHFWLVREL